MASFSFRSHPDTQPLPEGVPEDDGVATLLYSKDDNGGVNGLMQAQIPLGEAHMEVTLILPGQSSQGSEVELSALRTALMVGVRGLMVEGDVREVRLIIGHDQVAFCDHIDTGEPVSRAGLIEPPWRVIQELIPSPAGRITRKARTIDARNPELSVAERGQIETLFVRPGTRGLRGSDARIQNIIDRCIAASESSVRGRASGIDLTLMRRGTPRAESYELQYQHDRENASQISFGKGFSRDEFIGQGTFLKALEGNFEAVFPGFGRFSAATLLERFERDDVVASRPAQFDAILEGRTERRGISAAGTVLLHHQNTQHQTIQLGYHSTFRHAYDLDFSHNTVHVDPVGHFVEDLWTRRAPLDGETGFRAEFHDNPNAVQEVDQMMRMLMKEVQWE